MTIAMPATTVVAATARLAVCTSPAHHRRRTGRQSNTAPPLPGGHANLEDHFLTPLDPMSPDGDESLCRMLVLTIPLITWAS